MPFYRDPATILPEGMQRVLAMMGMRDPRAAMPGMSMMTVGPRAIPLDQPQQYIRRVLGETVGDIVERSADDVYGIPGRIMTSKGPEAAALRGWLNPQYADDARRAFQDTTDLGAPREALNEFDDRLVTWLANLFYGR